MNVIDQQLNSHATIVLGYQRVGYKRNAPLLEFGSRRSIPAQAQRLVQQRRLGVCIHGGKGNRGAGDASETRRNPKVVRTFGGGGVAGREGWRKPS